MPIELHDSELNSLELHSLELHKRLTRLSDHYRNCRISSRMFRRKLKKFNKSLKRKLFLEKVEKIKNDNKCGDFEAMFHAHYGDKIRNLSKNESVLLKAVRRNNGKK